MCPAPSAKDTAAPAASEREGEEKQPLLAFANNNFIAGGRVPTPEDSGKYAIAAGVLSVPAPCGRHESATAQSDSLADKCS